MFVRPAFILGVALALSAPASALTAISTPDATYRTTTTLIGIPANPVDRTSWGDPDLLVTFSTPLQPLTVPSEWATWGSPGDTEQSNPRIFSTKGVNSLTFTFSKPLGIWGFEAKSVNFGTHNFTVDYYDGAVLLGSVSRSIDGNAGARLLAASADLGTQFTKVVVNVDSGAGGFAIAQLRYGAVPEPATWAMLLLGFGLVGFSLRGRRGGIDSVSA